MRSNLLPLRLGRAGGLIVDGGEVPFKRIGVRAFPRNAGNLRGIMRNAVYLLGSGFITNR